MYNFKLDFETGHLTELSVPEKRISWFDQSLISYHSALLARWSTLRKVFRLWNRSEFHELRRAEYSGRRVDIRGNSINTGAIKNFLYQWALNNSESLRNCGARLRPKSPKFPRMMLSKPTRNRRVSRSWVCCVAGDKDMTRFTHTHMGNRRRSVVGGRS